MMDVPMPSRDGDLIIRLDVDHGVHRLGGHRGDHVVDVHAHFLEVALLQPGLGRNDVHEDVADRRAALIGDLQPLELLDLGQIEVLARDHLRGLAHISICAMATSPPLSWPMMKDCPA